MGFVGGWEFDLALLALAVGLAILGSGHYSVSGLRAAKRAEASGQTY